jgi:hypothetical protein
MNLASRALSFLAVLLAPCFAVAQVAGESERVAQRSALYAKLANHSLLQIVLVAPKGRTNVIKATDGTWRLVGDVVCVDATPLGEEIETRDVFELPDDARRQPISGAEFFRAIRHDPPRVSSTKQDADFDADFAAALQRFATAKLSKKVFVESSPGHAGCTPDVIAVPAVRFQKRAGARATQSLWAERLDNQQVAIFGMLTHGELRAARTQRLAAARDKMGPAAPGETTHAYAGPNAQYGALRIEARQFKPCYVAGDDPFPALVAWSLTSSDKVKRWMSAAPEAPKMIAELELVIGEFRKPAAQQQCSMLVASVPMLNQVKATLERQKLAATLFSETVTGQQVLAAYGFRNVEELRLARDLGLDSGEQFAPLRTLGIDSRDAYAKALERYMWSIGGQKPGVELVASFVRDEREAVARGISVKALRAERARREEDKGRRVTAALQ